MRSREVRRKLWKRQKQLYLDEWALQVMTVQADRIDEERVACVRDYQPGVPGARIEIACACSDEDVSNSCTHEVCHVRMADMHFAFERALQSLSDAEAQAHREAYTQAEERAVVAFTDLIERLETAAARAEED